MLGMTDTILSRIDPYPFPAPGRLALTVTLFVFQKVYAHVSRFDPQTEKVFEVIRERDWPWRRFHEDLHHPCFL